MIPDWFDFKEFISGFLVWLLIAIVTWGLLLSGFPEWRQWYIDVYIWILG